MNRLQRVAIAAPVAVVLAASESAGCAPARPAPTDTLSNVHYIDAGRTATPDGAQVWDAANFGAPVDNGQLEIGTNGYGDPLDGGFGVVCRVGDSILRVTVGQPDGSYVTTIAGDVAAAQQVVSDAAALGVPPC